MSFHASVLKSVASHGLAVLVMAAPLISSADDRMKLTPDFLQSDPEADFHSGGSFYCGPVSVSNAFFCLARQGFPRLRPEAQADKQAQIELIRKLASDGFMDTDRNGKTMLPELIQGIRRHLLEAGYEMGLLEFQGISAVPSDLEAFRASDRPDLKWIRRMLNRPDTALTAHLGWYEQVPGTADYRRKTGHHVTVVDMENEALIVHDPAFYAGKLASADRLELTAFPLARLVSSHTPKPVDSTGFYQVHVPKLKDKSIVCLLECVLAFAPK
jgi:hypothetical protein